MHAVPREKLRELVERFGPEIGRDARRCEALLRDVCGAFKKETFALSSAAREGIPAEIESAANGVPMKLLLGRMAKRLHENLGIADDLCRWTVETWAFALGRVTPHDLTRDATLAAEPATRCPQCAAAIKVPAQFHGSAAKCPKCAARLSVAPDGSRLQLRTAPARAAAVPAVKVQRSRHNGTTATFVRVFALLFAALILGFVYLLCDPSFDFEFAVVSKPTPPAETITTAPKQSEPTQAKLNAALAQWLPVAPEANTEASGLSPNLLTDGHEIAQLFPATSSDLFGGTTHESLRGKVTRIEVTGDVYYCHVEFPVSAGELDLKHFTVYRQQSLVEIEAKYAGKLQFVRQTGSDVVCRYEPTFTPNIDDTVLASDADDIVD